MKQRLALVQAESNIEKLEEKIGMGQIEEVIEQVRAYIEIAFFFYSMSFLNWFNFFEIGC